MIWRTDKPDRIGVYVVTVELVGEDRNRITCCAEYMGNEDMRRVEDEFSGAVAYTKEWRIMWPVTDADAADYGTERDDIEEMARAAYKTARVVAWGDEISPCPSDDPKTIYGDYGWMDEPPANMVDNRGGKHGQNNDGGLV